MLAAEYQDTVRRVTEATSVAELRSISRRVKLDHPDDPDAQAIEDTALFMASGLLCDMPAAKREGRDPRVPAGHGGGPMPRAKHPLAHDCG